MADYPPTTEELIEQLARVRDLAAKLPPSMQSVHKDLADLYEWVNALRSGAHIRQRP